MFPLLGLERGYGALDAGVRGRGYAMFPSVTALAARGSTSQRGLSRSQICIRYARPHARRECLMYRAHVSHGSFGTWASGVC